MRWWMSKPNPSKVIDERTLRITLCILGIVFPLVLLAGGVAGGDPGLRPSISAYHWHPQMGMFYTGVLWAIGVFLFSYRGPKFLGYEDWSGYVAAIGALMTATFYPKLYPKLNGKEFCDRYACSSLPDVFSEVVTCLHLVGTILVLASFIIFTALYWWKSRGWLRFLCLFATVAGGILAIFGVFVKEAYGSWEQFPTGIFWGETMVIWGFSIAWIKK